MGSAETASRSGAIVNKVAEAGGQRNWKELEGYLLDY
jgi:hypothetical protein